jgi:molybdate transport repressor ModE-like protein
MFDPRHLRLLQEIARTGSLSAAAVELGFSQPAVSYQLRSLEREVGTVLVVRNGRATRLTPAGEALAVHADTILSSIQTAEQSLADIVGTRAGLVRIAAFPSGCATIVPAAMAAMRRARPSVDIRLFQAEPPEALAMVRRGEADLAVSYRYDLPMPNRRAASRDAPLRRVALLEDPVRLVLPVGHPLADRPEIEMADLADATWIISSQCFEGILHRAALAAGFTPTVSMVADDYVAMQALVAHRLGVAVLPRLSLFAHRDERVVSRPVRDWPPRLVEVELWPDRMRVDAVCAMLGALREAVVPHTAVPV